METRERGVHPIVILDTILESRGYEVTLIEGQQVLSLDEQLSVV